MEISKELKILKVLDNIVLDLKEKEEYNIIKKLYEGLLEENIIPPIESLEKGETFVGSIEGHLLYRFLVAARQSWLNSKYVTDVTGEPFEQGEL